MVISPPIISFSIQLKSRIAAFYLTCQGEIAKKIFKIAFSSFISITIIKTVKNKTASNMKRIQCINSEITQKSLLFYCRNSASTK